MRTDPEVTRHLRGVLAALSTGPSTPLRRGVLERLAAYADAGVFPRPDAVRVRPRAVTPPRAFAGPGERMPLFRDARGTFCAVGHLYAADEPAAAAALADRVGDAYLPEVEDAGLRAWAARRSGASGTAGPATSRPPSAASRWRAAARPGWRRSPSSRGAAGQPERDQPRSAIGTYRVSVGPV